MSRPRGPTTWRNRNRVPTYNVGATTARMEQSERAHWEMEAAALQFKEAHGIDDDALRVRGAVMTDQLLKTASPLIPVAQTGDAELTDADDAGDIFPNLKMTAAVAAVVQRHPYFEQMLLGINDLELGFANDEELMRYVGVHAGLSPKDKPQPTDGDELIRTLTFMPVLPEERMDAAEAIVLSVRAGRDPAAHGPAIPTSVAGGPEASISEAGDDEEEVTSILDDCLKIDLTIEFDPIQQKYFIREWIMYLNSEKQKKKKKK